MCSSDLQTLLPALDATNPTGTGLLAFLFSTVEIGVAVSLACVPFLRPLFRGTFGSSNRSRPEASGYKFSSKGDKPSRGVPGTWSRSRKRGTWPSRPAGLARRLTSTRQLLTLLVTATQRAVADRCVPPYSLTVRLLF